MKIYYGKAIYGKDEIIAVNKVLKENSLNLIDGPHVKLLERKIAKLFGPIFRSKNKITNNLIQTNVGKSEEERNKIINSMWGNYGRILAEYNFLERFKKGSLNSYI